MKLHVKVLTQIDSCCRSYMWYRTNMITKGILVAWDKICTPKFIGGLNLINLQLWNKPAIAKTCWDLAHKLKRINYGLDGSILITSKANNWMKQSMMRNTFNYYLTVQESYVSAWYSKMMPDLRPNLPCGYIFKVNYWQLTSW